MSEMINEKLLIRYLSAVERGDFETVADVLEQAEQNAELETMIMEIHEEWAIEDTVQATEAELQVKKLLHEYFPSSYEIKDLNSDMPPLTVADVAAKMQADTSVKGSRNRDVIQVTNRLQDIQINLPESLSDSSISTLFKQLGIAVSKQVQSLFRDTAVFMSMGRQQHQAQWAATRRQQQSKSTNGKDKD